MTTLSITLSDEQVRLIEEQARIEGHPSANDYLFAVVQDILRRRARREVEMLLLESLDGEPPTEMTESDWEGLRDRAAGGTTGSPTA